MTRTLLRSILFLAAACALGSCAREEDDPNVVVVHVGAGSWADANMAAYVRPFEQETGIKVIGFADDMKVSQLKLMHDANSVEVDVISFVALEAARAAKLGLSQDIDYSKFDPEELEGVDAAIRKPYGAPALYYSMVIAYDSKKVQGELGTWADLWDAQKFPGGRTLLTGQYGDGPWEEALLADGVAPDKIYPIDVDRVFRSLDRIRPHIVKWWRVGSEGQQLFRDGQVQVGGVYDGRIAELAKPESGIRYTYNQAKLLMDYWVIPKKAPHSANAQRFVEFAMRARQQAIFAQKIQYGPTNKGAYQHISAERAKLLPSYPDNMARQVPLNADWYVEAGPDGVDNTEKMINRWNQWILE
jgi:putative spermidine/putrescine transport system substrate-binding protein